MNDGESGLLDASLLEAHGANDRERLAHLYVRAADDRERAGDVDAACFFLTQAWVFALQADLPEAASVRERLARHGRVRSVEAVPKGDPDRSRRGSPR